MGRGKGKKGREKNTKGGKGSGARVKEWGGKEKGKMKGRGKGKGEKVSHGDKTCFYVVIL